ncbi:Heat shock protein Hsp90, partial [Cynara cardunculus var. scolymus]
MKIFGFHNASDPLDKLRFLSVMNPSLLGDADELEILSKPDLEKGTNTISFGRDIDHGTIAQSSTSKFLNALKFIGGCLKSFFHEGVTVSIRSPKAIANMTSLSQVGFRI